MKRVTIFLLTLFFSVAAAAAGYGGKSDNSQQSDDAAKLPAFSKIDKNNDMWLSWKEAKSAGISKKMFKEGDYDNDGKM